MRPASQNQDVVHGPGEFAIYQAPAGEGGGG